MTDETKAPAPEALDEETKSEAAAGGQGDEPSESSKEEALAGSLAKPKKLKKGKKAAPKEGEKLEVLDASPEGQQLRQAQIAFEIGDYASTRAIASKLAGHERASIADGARDLLRRTDVDPAQMIFLAACLCALIGVAFYYLR